MADEKKPTENLTQPIVEENVIVKKVRPYPFNAAFVGSQRNFIGKVVKLVMHGFMVELGKTVVAPGETFDVTLSLPAKYGQIVARTKVIKTYDRLKGPEMGGATERLVEMHFARYPLPERDSDKIKAFLEAIRQKKGSDFS